VRDGQPDLVVSRVHHDDVIGIALEPVAIPVDPLRGSVGDPSGTISQRAHEKVHLETERDEEHEEKRDRVPQLGWPEYPREDEGDESDPHP